MEVLHFLSIAIDFQWLLWEEKYAALSPRCILPWLIEWKWIPRLRRSPLPQEMYAVNKGCSFILNGAETIRAIVDRANLCCCKPQKTGGLLLSQQRRSMCLWFNHLWLSHHYLYSPKLGDTKLYLLSLLSVTSSRIFHGKFCSMKHGV